MEKIRVHEKNEMHDLYFKVVKKKLDEIVGFINSITGQSDDTVIDEVVDIDDTVLGEEFEKDTT